MNMQMCLYASCLEIFEAKTCNTGTGLRTYLAMRNMRTSFEITMVDVAMLNME
jgi:hypothetical protein